ncbi:hypothetical protein SG34_017420 [Thalassomonas viridans]|uniref:Uncharacterized protein n=1 Tax=Thalassomonas viridans TaxID=137584 RepID=A0AAE9Z0Z4_9GAMM|nr:hypothetical protein [Thalassomonas viridans]WDE03188.1 hypothetical protein SG34_017420 [Thalassomonas viridans]
MLLIKMFSRRVNTLIFGLAFSCLLLCPPGLAANGQGEKQQPPEQETVPEGRAVLSFYPLTDKAKIAEHRLSDKVIPYPANPVPRLEPLMELGDDFLGHGPIKPGIKTPFEQMLQPSFLLYGQFRSALQSYDAEDREVVQWSTRLDLHGDVKLSGTERLVFSLRPLDNDKGEDTGYIFSSDGDEEHWHDQTNGKLTQLFFEGEIGEIFPRLDPGDNKTWDIGFSVGRQELKVQDGILLSDTLDAFGITRNSLIAAGLPNLRLTGLYSWHDIDNPFAGDTSPGRLFGLLTQADTAWDNTLDFDMIYVDNDKGANAWYLGLGSTQRIGTINSTFRINTEIPQAEDSAALNQGTLVTAELSGAFAHSDDLWYFNSFLSFDDFSSAARSRDAGVELANIGMLFSPVGMGQYGVPLGDSIADTYGAVAGYQHFFGGIGSQLIVELAARSSMKSERKQDAVGVGLRYQKALSRQTLLRFDTFFAVKEKQQSAKGVRLEWLLKF